MAVGRARPKASVEACQSSSIGFPAHVDARERAPAQFLEHGMGKGDDDAVPGGAHPGSSQEAPGWSTTPEVEVIAPPVTGVAVDPVCGMTVATVSASPLVLDGETVWFCGAGCWASYAREHALG